MLSLVLIYIICVFCEATKKEITEIPLFKGTIPFKQYSGYVTVNEEHNRNLFYWFVESQGDPTKDPVVLWLSGGPGCSSMEGSIQENGPFLLNADGTAISFNDYSWNKVASVVYVDSPAGVGFSYSDYEVDYSTCNDNRTSDDMYEFLQRFFQDLFPELKENPFFVAAESYGGHYGTVVSRRIHQGNTYLKSGDIHLNLQGYLLGNGASDMSNDQNSMIEFMRGHSLISMRSYEEGYKACKGDFYKNQALPDCATSLNQFMEAVNGINIYGIYYPCYGGVGNQSETAQIRKRFYSQFPDVHPLFRYSRSLSPYLYSGANSGGIPCYDASNMVKYYNMDSVLDAFGVRKDKIPTEGNKWACCNYIVNENYDWTWESMIPFHIDLVKAGLRVLLYSGDIDMAVNNLGTQMTAEEVAPGIGNSFKEWYFDDPVDGKQVAGYTSKIGNFGYTTFRGAGHMVPQYQGNSAFKMFDKFLKNEDL